MTIFDLLLLSMDTPQQNKSHKGGSVFRTNPSDMHLFDVEPMIMKVFQRVGWSLSVKTCRGDTLKKQGSFL
jgi:hypothetical protein